MNFRINFKSRAGRRAALVAGVFAAAILPINFLAGSDVEAVDETFTVLTTGGFEQVFEPRVSGDGNWVVFEASIDDRRTVARANLNTGEVTEISPIPDASKPGDTVDPAISADGCVIAAITEVAYDLYRDNNYRDRWDVYRLVTPECGGQPNAWELVSSGVDGTATDLALPGDPPAISGSGALIAYVHADERGDDLSSISVVDLTVPITDGNRAEPVAGTPAEAPNRAYLYRGAREPVISHNGRHLGFTADFTAAELLPGWAEGPQQGGPATRQVYVWDRESANELQPVHLVSGVDDKAAPGGASAPSMSEDGRIITFQSADQTLVSAIYPICDQKCASQVYRYDRDTDGNGVFDETSENPPLRIISATDAGAPDQGLPTAGDASSWSATVSDDGSQVAFVTDASNLMVSRRGGGGGEHAGDLLVAEAELNQVRRVLGTADTAAVPGAHSAPSLSSTGQVTVFETAVAGKITGAGPAHGGVQIAIARTKPVLSMAEIDFGTVRPHFDSAEMYVAVQNAGPAAFAPLTATTSPGPFRVTGGTCARGVIVAAGESCTVKVIFAPTEARGYETTLTVTGIGEGAPSVSTVLRGAAGEPTLLTDPGGIDFDYGVVGTTAGETSIGVINTGFGPVEITELYIAGANPDDFKIVGHVCTNRALNPRASCAVQIEFVPTAAGYRSAMLIARTSTGSYTSSVLGGSAHYIPMFEAAQTTVEAGAEIGVGGHGFPADTEVSLRLDQNGDAVTTVKTDAEGRFLAQVTVPLNTHPGQQNLIAFTAGDIISEASVRVTTVSPPVYLPGYGPS